MHHHRLRKWLLASFALIGTLGLAAAAMWSIRAASAPPDDGKLRIICFGAHPDDCELQAGGVAALWAAKGHHVKLVSVTNGDIGHWREAGGPLAKVRNGDVIRLDAVAGTLDALVSEAEWAARPAATMSAELADDYAHGLGRELFAGMRKNALSAEQGACTWL